MGEAGLLREFRVRIGAQYETLKQRACQREETHRDRHSFRAKVDGGYIGPLTPARENEKNVRNRRERNRVVTNGGEVGDHRISRGQQNQNADDNQEKKEAGKEKRRRRSRGRWLFINTKPYISHPGRGPSGGTNT